MLLMSFSCLFLACQNQTYNAFACGEVRRASEGGGGGGWFGGT